MLCGSFWFALEAEGEIGVESMSLILLMIIYQKWKKKFLLYGEEVPIHLH